MEIACRAVQPFRPQYYQIVIACHAITVACRSCTRRESA
jgi:hypothetical protein